MATEIKRIQVRRGLAADLPVLAAGEPAFTTDTREMYVGSSVGNIRVHGDYITPEQYGAKGDGVADDTAAIQAAIDTHKRVKLAYGKTYLFSNLKIDGSAWGGISGEGKTSILKTTVAANVGIQIGTVVLVEHYLLEDFLLQGNSTNIGGIQIGDAPQYVAWLKMRGVRVMGFTKAASGYGVGFYCAQEIDIEDCNLSGNAINYYRPNVGSLTSCRIHGFAGYMGLSVTCGAYFAGTVSDLRFENMVIESNQKEAIRSGRTSNIIINNVDFEDNNNTDTGGAVIDIGSSDAGYSTLNMQNCHVSETPRANPFLRLGFVRRSIVAHNESYLLSGTVTGATTQCVLIDNGFQDFATYGALLGDIYMEEWNATTTDQRDITGNPKFAKVHISATGGDPDLAEGTNTQALKIKSSWNSELDFGIHSTGSYGGWIQARQPTSGFAAKSLSLNPLGGQVAIGDSVVIATGTAPVSSPANAFQQYSADAGAVAGQAGPHWRTEGGGIFGMRSDTGKTLQYVYQKDDLADDGTVTLPGATSGMVLVSCNGEAGMWLVQTDGTVTKISGSTNTAAADTDAKLCVYDGGTGAIVKNRLGATGEIRIVYYYN